ncbi:hypothetical protein [Paenibacillus alvei]|uniref:Uncharacterized protein n=1 Tax=Paenibacillus alvei TaxID=44250 RepID=A0A383R780_PAEAL|nr:hypothetical protein [Paenibacillus alvei]SYX83007.1 conserved exported protein of unknown function [Paenibacillus alvei]
MKRKLLISVTAGALVVMTTLVIQSYAGSKIPIYVFGNHNAIYKPLKQHELRDDPNNPYFYAPVKLTPEEIEHNKWLTGRIVTKHGEFERVREHDTSISEDETVYSSDDIKENTKQVIDHGVFIKTK